MEIFTNWMNNLVAKPSFHTFIKRIPIIRRLALNDGKIIYDLVAGFVYSQVLLAIIELRLIDFYVANDFRLCALLKSDGIYLSSHNKSLKALYFKTRQFKIIGSAHNYREINLKSGLIILLFETRQEK